MNPVRSISEGGIDFVSKLESRGNLTGWLGTIVSKAVRALAARLVKPQNIFGDNPRRLCLLVPCLLQVHSIVHVLVLSLAASLMCVK